VSFLIDELTISDHFCYCKPFHGQILKNTACVAYKASFIIDIRVERLETMELKH